MSVNPLEKYPKMNALFTTAMTLAAAYLGYEKVEQQMSTVEVEIVAPEQHGVEQHSHPAHTHKDWLPVIKQEIGKAKASHSQNHH